MKVNVDLEKERSRCSFSVNELTTLIDGGADKTRERKAIEDVMLSRRDLLEDLPEEYMSHKERYENSVKKSVILFGLVRKLQEQGLNNIMDYRGALSNILGSATLRDGSPLGIHYLMFIPALMSQGDEEQQAYWVPRAWNFNIIGSYGQTELGHGTFIRGLETTATYDADARQFVLHSPQLSAYKWWPGGLGQTANYCIVVAQLCTQGKCHGIHSFIVQIRDEETHMPLPGIKVGDIGGKMGLNSVNNGFLGFENVRIPRRNMLMKHAKVLEDGTYVKSLHSKLNYGAMVFVRVVIVYDTINYLSKAATIAVRYSAVRRQCQLKESELECQIIDYVTQQHKIFTAIATCHALRVIADKLWKTFYDITDQLNGGNLNRLPELHALACCLKAVSTSDTARLVEQCRLACGGHGYMHSSNLPYLYGIVTASCTYEGENTVLLLQTARFLIKSCQQSASELTPTISYLKHAREQGFCDVWENSVEGIIRGFQVVAMKKISTAVENLQNKMSLGVSPEDAWNQTSIQLAAAAEAHCRVIIIETFFNETMAISKSCSSELRRVLIQLVELYSVYWILEKCSDFLRYTSISKNDVDFLQKWYEKLLADIRPNAVGLVDSFDICDDILQSTLGAYDGRVYERLMKEAQRSPLNSEPVNDSFHKYLKPFMQGKL